MYFFYNIAVYIAYFGLKIIAIFNKKISLFVKGRKDIFQKLEDSLSSTDKVIWFHCASLGEFEQGRPIIENCKKQFSNYKMLVTFFSPSGYEIRKDYYIADLVTYLPIDTKKNVYRFLDIVDPDIAIFIKYEFWPNLLKELGNRKVKTILVSGIFRKEQSFFKWYGGWMRRSLKTFGHFFVQNESSKELIQKIGYKNATISGDTRFDRVYDITRQDNSMEVINTFTTNKTILVAGSTWLKDEELLVNFINTKASPEQKFIIAPHNINAEAIGKLKNSIAKKTILFTEINSKDVSSYDALIIDTIGILSKIYSYADIAYVGGGFRGGIHNILEPATFGIPILIGPKYQKFNEAKELVTLGACSEIVNGSEFDSELTELFSNKEEREKRGKIAGDYILKNVGATEKIISYLNNEM